MAKLLNKITRYLCKWYNWRWTKGKYEQIKLTPKTVVGLEDAISMAREDEVVEITPKSIRIRKRALDKGERRRQKRDEKSRGY